MLSTTVALLLLIFVLGVFSLVAFRASKPAEEMSVDDYFTARGSLTTSKVGFTLFASSIGGWLLFGPPQVAYFGGFFDVMGYAIAVMVPLILVAYIGPVIRRHAPMGITLGDYAGIAVGRRMQASIGGLCVLLMLALLISELAAAGRALAFLTGLSSTSVIIMIASVTAMYTAYGGLRASLHTDVWQAIAILILVTVIFASMLGDLGQFLTDAATYTPVDRFNDWEHGSIAQFTMGSFLSGLALLISLTCLQLFNQGNWQRVYAAESDEAVTKGALLAASMVFPMMFIIGFLGTAIAGSKGPLEDASATFLVLAETFSPLLQACAVVLIISLVCSTSDSLLNSVVVSCSRDFLGVMPTISQARKASLLVMGVVVLFALSDSPPQAFGSDFFLFLELMATAVAVPLFLTLIDEIHPETAVTGAIGGIVCVFLYGFLVPLENAAGPLYSVFPDRIATGLHYILKPVGTSGGPHLNIFITALVGSALLTYLASRMITQEDVGHDEAE